jgi:hypothetical protein
MIALTISVLLAALGVAVFPCWPHSTRWGYAPSLTVGGLLILVAAMTLGNRPISDGSRSPLIRSAQQVELSAVEPPIPRPADAAHP